MSNDLESDNGKPNRLASIREHFQAEVTESWGDLILILSCFVTGLLDSAVFNVWSCFVSMQTGQYPFSLHAFPSPTLRKTLRSVLFYSALVCSKADHTAQATPSMSASASPANPKTSPGAGPNPASPSSASSSAPSSSAG